MLSLVKILLESYSRGLKELYHFTTISSLLSICKSDRVLLSSSDSTDWNRSVSDGYPYYLSLTREKGFDKGYPGSKNIRKETSNIEKMLVRITFNVDNQTSSQDQSTLSLRTNLGNKYAGKSENLNYYMHVNPQDPRMTKELRDTLKQLGIWDPECKQDVKAREAASEQEERLLSTRGVLNHALSYITDITIDIPKVVKNDNKTSTPGYDFFIPFYRCLRGILPYRNKVPIHILYEGELTFRNGDKFYTEKYSKSTPLDLTRDSDYKAVEMLIVRTLKKQQGGLNSQSEKSNKQYNKLVSRKEHTLPRGVLNELVKVVAGVLYGEKEKKAKQLMSGFVSKLEDWSWYEGRDYNNLISFREFGFMRNCLEATKNIKNRRDFEAVLKSHKDVFKGLVGSQLDLKGYFYTFLENYVDYLNNVLHIEKVDYRVRNNLESIIEYKEDKYFPSSSSTRDSRWKKVR